MTTSAQERRAGWLLAGLVFIWGASWPVIKIGVTAIPPIWFACLRYVVATVFLVAIVWLRDELTLPSVSDWRLIAVSSIFQMAAYSALTGLALTHLPPGRSAALAFSTPLWVVPLSVWWLHERVRWSRHVGAAIGLMGVLVIASPGLHLAPRDQLVPYALLLLAAAGWAISIAFVRSHRFQASAFALAPWQTLVAALVLLPCAIAVNGPLLAPNVRGVASLAYVGPIATAFAYWAVVEAGRHVKATTVSVALQGVPSVGLLISAFVYHEVVDVSLTLGIILIGAGVALACTVTAEGAHDRAGEQ